MFLTTIATAAVCIILTALWLYVRWHRGTLEKMGIPVVEGHPLLGSARELYNKVGGLHDLELMKKYGPIFGVYEGREPQVFICVPELIRLICEKDANHFDAKRKLEFGDPVLNEMPDIQHYEKWKFLRNLYTPIFTTAKLKLLNLPMKEATQDFVNSLKEKVRQSGKAGVHEKYAIDVGIHTMLTDLIGRCVFSVKISGNTDENNEFVRIVQELAEPTTNTQNQALLEWSYAFPIFKKFVPGLFDPEPVQRFVILLRQLMDERKKSGVKGNDILDTIIEWFDRLDTPEMKKAGVTELTLICQALVFYFAAQDQICTVAACVIYHMVMDANLEMRIYEEIDRVFAKHGGNIGHENLDEMELLNSCINESLRLYPYFHRLERMCTVDWKNEEYNLSIKKGMTVQIPLWAVNRNEEYNENAEDFDAERFLPGKREKLNPYSTASSFGFGKRNCVGKRFGYESFKIILAYVLKELKFKRRDDTELTFLKGGPVFAPHKKIFVDVMERE